MINHVKILGILHIIFSSLGIVVAVGMLILFGGLAGVLGTTDKSEDSIVGVGVLGAIGAIVFMVILVLSLPGLIAGIGLIKFKPWARILGIVISALDLISVPFGTALGIYGLWVLLSNETEALFRDPNAYMLSGPAGPLGPVA